MDDVTARSRLHCVTVQAEEPVYGPGIGIVHLCAGRRQSVEVGRSRVGGTVRGSRYIRPSFVGAG